MTQDFQDASTDDLRVRFMEGFQRHVEKDFIITPLRAVFSFRFVSRLLSLRAHCLYYQRIDKLTRVDFRSVDFYV